MYSLKANQPYEEKNLSFINVEKTSFGYALSKFYLTKISELLNIKINQVANIRDKLYINGKGNKQRLVIFNKNALDLLNF